MSMKIGLSILFFIQLMIWSSSGIANSDYRMVGYWSLANGYANQAGCAPILTPDRIPAELYTHIIFSFVFIDPNGSNTIMEPTPEQITYFNQVQDMRNRNPNIKLEVSLGGWSMNMSLYSKAVATAESRATLVQSCMEFVRKWNWDGIDFDWEYPNDPQRFGSPSDPENFALFIAEMRKAVEAEQIPSGKSKLELSIALPGGPYHGVNYIMPSMIQNLDFANIMAYNLHGPWETQVYCSANFYDGTPENSKYHGYSIYDAVQYFLNQNGSKLPAEKFNLGVTFAGVMFTLADGTQFTPGSPAIGEGKGGPCTKEAGYMAYFEVENVLNSDPSIKPAFDDVGKCKYFVYNGNQWVGYDDAETLKAKVALVEEMGLGGISVWAMYAESGNSPVLQTAINEQLYNPDGSPDSGASLLSFGVLTLGLVSLFI